MRKRFRTLIAAFVVLKAIAVPLQAQVSAEWLALHDLQGNKATISPLSDFARARRLERIRKTKRLSQVHKLVQLSPELSSTTPPAGALDALFTDGDWYDEVSAASSHSSAILKNTAPSLKLKELKIESSEACEQLVNASDFDGGSTDADGDELQFTFFEDGLEVRSFPVGNHVVEIEVTDGTNYIRGTTTLKVEDKTPPLAVAKNLTVALSGTGQATVLAAQLNDGSNDSCSEISLSISQTDFACADLGENEVTLTVTDSYGNEATAVAMVTVVDLLAPSMPAEYTFSADENSPQHTLLGIIQAADNCGTLSYFIKTGNTGGAFSINSNTGEMKVANAAVLDYESTTSFTLTIEARDNSDNAATASVVISLNDLNDNLPVAGTSIAAAQQTLEDEAYAYTVPADAFTDADASDELTWSAPALPAWLSFNPHTRTLSGTPLNEHVGTYELKIRATDKAGQFAEQSFALQVSNTNDAPHGIQLSNGVLEENEPADTELGSLSSLDVDAADAHTYRLAEGAGDTDNTYFAIEGNMLRTLRPLNFEEKEDYSVRISTTDLEGAVYEQVFTVTVLDLPDSEPFLPNLFSPNGDDSNDHFIVRAYHLEQLQLRIFNKQGKLVYETSSIEEATQKGWDGTTNGKPQPEGTYVWQLNGRHKDGTPLSIGGRNMGNISLIR